MNTIMMPPHLLALVPLAPVGSVTAGIGGPADRPAAGRSLSIIVSLSLRIRYRSTCCQHVDHSIGCVALQANCVIQMHHKRLHTIQATKDLDKLNTHLRQRKAACRTHQLPRLSTGVQLGVRVLHEIQKVLQLPVRQSQVKFVKVDRRLHFEPRDSKQSPNPMGAPKYAAVQACI